MGTWRKSTYSDANGGQCVEVADRDGAILVRDTADRVATLAVAPTAWTTFLASITR
jgi:hypothetical protein